MDAANPPRANPVNSASETNATRREFLAHTARGLGVLALGSLASPLLARSAFAPAPESDRTILVLIHLAGGNDGLNTLVPFEDDDYFRLRPTLAIAKNNVLRVSATLGLHPSCTALHRLFHEGNLAVMQNVGCPNPSRSHFRSTEIWETARADGAADDPGWLGRFLAHARAGDSHNNSDPVALHLADARPQSFAGARAHQTFGWRAETISPLAQANIFSGKNFSGPFAHACATEEKIRAALARHRPASAYPVNKFSHTLRDTSALIAANFSARVHFISLGGFDTHGNQQSQHANLLATLSDGLAAFQRDLAAHKLADQVLTMTFSEFGRRPRENEMHGTDHGTAAPLFVLGSRVRGGLHGTAPSLKLAQDQDLVFSMDFRSVYATMLERWLKCPSGAILDGHFSPLNIL